jgi:hypothetical protein
MRPHFAHCASDIQLPICSDLCLREFIRRCGDFSLYRGLSRSSGAMAAATEALADLAKVPVSHRTNVGRWAGLAYAAIEPCYAGGRAEPRRAERITHRRFNDVRSYVGSWR